MPLYTFGGTPADVLTDAQGNVIPDYPLVVRVAGTGAAVTALYEDDGLTPIAQLRSNPASSPTPGAIRTFKTADVTAIDYEYLDGSGSPVRWYQAARELAAQAQATAEAALPRSGGTMTGTTQYNGSAGDVVDASLVAAQGGYDTYRRLADGEEQWGPGDAARDVRWYRSGPRQMTLTGSIVAEDGVNLAVPGWFTVTGAAGDGITDDRPAIQAALDAARDAGGGTVILPGGKTYGVSTFLVVHSGTTIWAYGATIKAIANSGILRNFITGEEFAGYSGRSHITLLGGTYDGNASDGVTGTVTAETDVINFVHGADITVRDVTVLNTSTAHALEFNSVDGGRAINCQFYGFRDNSSGGTRGFSEAIQIDISKSGSSSIGLYDNTPAKNIRIESCTFGPSDRLGNFGRAVGSHSITAGVTYDDIQIVNCQINGALQEGIYAYGWRRAKIEGNTIRNTGMSGIMATIPNPATTSVPAATVSITDNTIEAVQSDSGIRVLAYAAYRYPGVVIETNTIRSITGNAVQVEQCEAPKVTGNLSEDTTSTGLYAAWSPSASFTSNTVRNSGSNGINATGSPRTLMQGNIIDGTGSNFGLFAGQASDGANSTDCHITGNTIYAASSAGIRASTSATGCTITGNKVRKGASTANGITLASTATGCVIAGNDLSGNGWASGTALSLSTATPKLDYAGGTTSPGHNLI
ncbi:right-handed parallel beta-helix repeat-containing protein [Streptomyces sp. NPDC006265]|uniref:right-handed parallel beta-helix repeat-containing protein n=1 Tax=Streptomyces sp. NPDC006265 TaxID=3156740 RepID=UPI0033A1A887